MEDQLRTPATPAALDTQSQFYLQEHRLLREEIYKIVADIRLIQRGALLGLGGYFGWMSSSIRPTDPGSLLLATWLPFLFALLLRALSKRRIRAIFVAADYLTLLEAKLTTDNGGWETYLKAYRENPSESLESTQMDELFWNIACVATGLLAMISTGVFLFERLNEAWLI